MTSKTVLVVAGLLLAVSAEAAVLCNTRSGTVKLRNACKRRERQIDPITLSLQGPPGPQGPAGPPGERGAAGVCVCPPAVGTTTTTLPSACGANLAGGPRQLDYTIADSGTDLDIGFAGTSHNFPIIADAGFSLCLSDCDGSTNPVCKATGPTGAGSLNGDTLGPPLPLFAAGTPVCVINRFSIPEIRGTVNVQTGEYRSEVDGTPTPILLDWVVFSTSAIQVCPECDGGICDSGPNQGEACTVDGTVRVRNPQQGIDKVYNLASECPPGGLQGARTGVVPINLPLTTGTASISGSRPCPGQPLDDQCGTFGASCSNNCGGQIDVKGGINQWCCTDAANTPCFPTASNSGEPNHAIVRTGTAVPPTPVWPDPVYPKIASSAKLVAAFCLSDTGSTVINQVAGIPGPGALILNGTQQWLASQ